MKSDLTPEQLYKRNKRIRKLFFVYEWPVRRIQNKFNLKSPKSVWAILYPERHNENQRKRYLIKKELSTA